MAKPIQAPTMLAAVQAMLMVMGADLTGVFSVTRVSPQKARDAIEEVLGSSTLSASITYPPEGSYAPPKTPIGQEVMAYELCLGETAHGGYIVVIVGTDGRAMAVFHSIV